MTIKTVVGAYQNVLKPITWLRWYICQLTHGWWAEIISSVISSGLPATYLSLLQSKHRSIDIPVTYIWFIVSTLVLVMNITDVLVTW